MIMSITGDDIKGNLTIKILIFQYNMPHISAHALIDQDLKRLGINAIIDNGMADITSQAPALLHNLTFNNQEDMNLYKISGSIKEVNDEYKTLESAGMPIYRWSGDL